MHSTLWQFLNWWCPKGQQSVHRKKKYYFQVLFLTLHNKTQDNLEPANVSFCSVIREANTIIKSVFTVILVVTFFFVQRTCLLWLCEDIVFLLACFSGHCQIKMVKNLADVYAVVCATHICARFHQGLCKKLRCLCTPTHSHLWKTAVWHSHVCTPVLLCFHVTPHFKFKYHWSYIVK